MNNLLHFPTDLIDKGRPYIRFACTPAKEYEPLRQICLPLVGAINYGDSANYATIDMGLIDAVADFVGDVSTEGLKKATTDAISKFKEQVDSVGGLGASILLARKLGQDRLGQAFEFRGKTIQNPRTNTTFGGNQIRSFGFNFKMIGRNPHEVRVIDDIQNTFRNRSYAAEQGSLMLQYPDQWTIQFLDPRNSNELDYIPKIYTCYLTSVNTTFNSSSNTYRHDMSPYEVDVSLQFQETKILTRDEMERLMDGDRFNQDEATATELINAGQSNVKALSEQLWEKADENLKPKEGNNNGTTRE